MLVKIERFKKDEIGGLSLNLKSTKNYTWNDHCYKDGIVKNAMIYGHSGCGKSSLLRSIYDLKFSRISIGNHEFNPKANSCKYRMTFNFNGELIEYSFHKNADWGVLDEVFIFQDVIIQDSISDWHDSRLIDENFLKSHPLLRQLADFIDGIVISQDFCANEKEVKRAHKIIKKLGYKPFNSNDGLEIFSNASMSLVNLYEKVLPLCTVLKPTLYLGEEFDNGLNRDDAVSLLEYIHGLDCQSILECKNSDLASNQFARPDSYFIMQEGKCESFYQSTDKDLRKAHNLRKMMVAGCFNNTIGN